MPLQLLAALFHFDQDALGPNQVGELGGFVPADAVFQLAADFEDAGVAEGFEEAIEKDLRFAFLVALEGGGEVDEFLEVLGGFMHGPTNLVTLRSRLGIGRSSLACSKPANDSYSCPGRAGLRA